MADYILVPILSALISLGADLIEDHQREQKLEQYEQQVSQSKVSQESELPRENPDPIDTNPPSLYN